MDFQMTVFDCDTEHAKGHVVNTKPNGRYYVFLSFKTPFLARTADGLERGEAGDFLIVSPDFPQYHTNVPDAGSGFVNSWCHCRGAAVTQWMEQYQIPANRILKIQSGIFFDDMLHTVRDETLQALPLCAEYIRNQFEKCLIELARQIQMKHKIKKQHFTELCMVRGKMLQDPAADYSLEQLARRANLSPSRFSHLYKAFFGASPIEELIRERLCQAERLLLTTDMRVEDIAAECGFCNVFHFSRQFKQKTGFAPSRYRGR